MGTSATQCLAVLFYSHVLTIFQHTFRQRSVEGGETSVQMVPWRCHGRPWRVSGGRLNDDETESIPYADLPLSLSRNIHVSFVASPSSPTSPTIVVRSHSLIIEPSVTFPQGTVNLKGHCARESGNSGAWLGHNLGAYPTTPEQLRVRHQRLACIHHARASARCRTWNKE